MRVIFLLFLITTGSLQSQSYAPAAGQVGSTAMAADSDLFVSWATGITVERGYVDISNPNFEANGSNLASYGEPENALGPATTTAVSLGDGGQAILIFDRPIKDGPGFDFAVFENSFSDTYLELAFVEVSSNGVDYFRFPAHSQTQTNVQVGGFGELDPSYINNLAGKYRAMFGTPFDLSDLDYNPLLDKNKITHIKIIDVVGSIDSAYARYDTYGNIINDPFTTPFYSSGFDLDAVGVIHEEILKINPNEKSSIEIYPNPVLKKLFVNYHKSFRAKIYDIHGRLIINTKGSYEGSIDVSILQNGVYVIIIFSEDKVFQKGFVKK